MAKPRAREANMEIKQGSKHRHAKEMIQTL